MCWCLSIIETYALFLSDFNPLNTKINPICRLLALLEAHHILHVSRIRVNGTCTLSTGFREILKCREKSVKWEPSCLMRTNGRKDITKLIVAFSEFCEKKMRPKSVSETRCCDSDVDKKIQLFRDVKYWNT